MEWNPLKIWTTNNKFLYIEYEYNVVLIKYQYSIYTIKKKISTFV